MSMHDDNEIWLKALTGQDDAADRAAADPATLTEARRLRETLQRRDRETRVRPTPEQRAAFLAKAREQGLIRKPPRRPRWLGGLAMAASIAVIAGILVTLLQGIPDNPDGPLIPKTLDIPQRVSDPAPQAYLRSLRTELGSAAGDWQEETLDDGAWRLRADLADTAATRLVLDRRGLAWPQDGRLLLRVAPR